MNTKVLLSQTERPCFLTPWKEEFRGKMRETLADAGADAPMFDSSLPSDFPGVVVKMALFHVAVTELSEKDAENRVADWRRFNDDVRKAAGISPDAAVRPIVVSAL